MQQIAPYASQALDLHLIVNAMIITTMIMVHANNVHSHVKTAQAQLLALVVYKALVNHLLVNAMIIFLKTI